ncbi:MAG TPA: DegT/DnrJ/EryC1/StrS family aminotransferase [Thermoanaerobaculia bacterium]
MRSVPVNTPDLREDDRRSVLECLESGWISSEGPQVARFESLFAEASGRAHGVAVSSGTAALDVVVRALGLGPGDEVLVPSLTIISCGQAVTAAGATLVPVDCDPSDWNATVKNFRARATPKTRALMLVHLYGLCADLDPILDWARESRLLVIEDASQALGLDYRGRPCGSFGDVSVFSLYANKLVTTGEGGMILTDSPQVATECRSLRNLCFQPERRFWHEELGWNYRMTAMQAALGIPQLRRLPELAGRKRTIGRTYHASLTRLPHLRMAPVTTPVAENVYWVFGLLVAEDAPFDREEILAALAARGVGTRTFFHGLHQQPALQNTGLLDAAPLQVTESLSERGFYLPSGLGLDPEDQEYVIRSVVEFVESRS